MVRESEANRDKAPGSSGPNSYDINFFKPHAPHARADMKIIIVMVTVWAVAVFGFQVLLMIFNKPVPEPALAAFKKAWPGVVEESTISAETKKEFARSLLSVLGKNVAVKPEHKAILKEALTWSVQDLVPAGQRQQFQANLADEATDEMRAQGVASAISAIGLESTGFDKLMTDLLPTSLVPVASASLSAAGREQLAAIMDLYLIHNRSGLTDTRFFGFPFHYWYTAQFLLIMFVCMCLIYAVLIDKMHKKHGFVEE